MMRTLLLIGLLVVILGQVSGCSVTSSPLEVLSEIPHNELTEQEILLREELRQNPDSPGIQMQLALVRLRLGDDKEAERLTSLAAIRRPFDGRLMALQGEIYLVQRKHFRALTAFNRAIERDADLLGAYVKLADVYFRLGQPEEGFSTLSTGLKREPYYFPAHYRKALGHFEMGELAEAQSAIDTAIRINRTDIPAMALRIRIAKNLGNLGQAKFFTNEALTAYPNSPLLLHEQLELHQQRRNWEQASKTILALQNLKELSVETKLLLARVLRDMGKTDESSKQLAEVLQNHPNHPEALYDSGQLALQENNLVEAVTNFSLSVEGDPSHIEAHVGKSIALYLQGQFHRGDASLDRAREIAPGHPSVRMLLARRKMGQGQFEEASAILEKYLREFPADGSALMTRADLHLFVGEVDKAERLLAEVAPGPDGLALIWAKARLALAKGAFQSALDISAPLMKKNPRWQVVYLQAVAQMRLGNMTTALNIMARSIRAGQGKGYLHRLAGELNMLAGKPTQAYSTLQQGARKFPDNLALVDSASRVAMELGRFTDVISLLKTAAEQRSPYQTRLLERLASAYTKTKQSRLAGLTLTKYFELSGILSPSGALAADKDPILGFLYTTESYDILTPSRSSR